MSGSDWRKFIKNRGGLVVALVVAAFFVIVIIQMARSLQWEADYDASRQAANYAAVADDQIIAECAGLAGRDRESCANKIDRSAREQQRNEYDLAAQQTMALWTAIMGGMAIVGVALSAIGVYLIWGTWKQTGEAAENSRRTLRAYIAKERAIMRVLVAKYKLQQRLRTPHTFLPEVHNLGQSPGHITSIDWSFTKKMEWPSTFDFSKAADVVISAQSISVSEFIYADADDLKGFMAVRMAYRTVEIGPFYSHAFFRISRDPAALDREWKWVAVISYALNQPPDT
jgi:uncharacterized membrane protein